MRRVTCIPRSSSSILKRETVQVSQQSEATYKQQEQMPFKRSIKIISRKKVEPESAQKKVLEVKTSPLRLHRTNTELLSVRTTRKAPPQIDFQHLIDDQIKQNNQDMKQEKEKVKLLKKEREVNKLFHEFGYDKTEEFKVATEAIRLYERKEEEKKRSRGGRKSQVTSIQSQQSSHSLMTQNSCGVDAQLENMCGNVQYIVEDFRKRYEALQEVEDSDERKLEKSRLEAGLDKDLVVVEDILRAMEGTRAERLNEKLCEVAEKAEGIKGWQIKSFLSYSLGVVFQRVLRVEQSIMLFKEARRLSKAQDHLALLIASYQGLGQCFQHLREYRQSKYYFHKMLQYAWLAGNGKAELLAYDYIGLSYFYLEDIPTAYFFYHKSNSLQVEPPESSQKEMGILKLRTQFFKKRMKNTFESCREEQLFEISSDDDEYVYTLSIEQKRRVEETMNSNQFEANRQTNIKSSRHNANVNIRLGSVRQEQRQMKAEGRREYECLFMNRKVQVKTKKYQTHLNPTRGNQFFFSDRTASNLKADMLFDKTQEKQLVLKQLNQYKQLDRHTDKCILRENLSRYSHALGQFRQMATQCSLLLQKAHQLRNRFHNLPSKQSKEKGLSKAMRSLISRIH